METKTKAKASLQKVTPRVEVVIDDLLTQDEGKTHRFEKNTFEKQTLEKNEFEKNTFKTNTLNKTLKTFFSRRDIVLANWHAQESVMPSPFKNPRADARSAGVPVNEMAKRKTGDGDTLLDHL